MKTLSFTAEPDVEIDASIGRELARGDADAIAVSERARRQIGAQASGRKVNLWGNSVMVAGASGRGRSDRVAMCGSPKGTFEPQNSRSPVDGRNLLGADGVPRCSAVVSLQSWRKARRWP